MPDPLPSQSTADTRQCANGHELAGFEPCPFCILEARDALRQECDRYRARLREAEALLRGFVYDEYEGERDALTVDATVWLADA